jgi:hypothetical protein
MPTIATTMIRRRRIGLSLPRQSSAVVAAYGSIADIDARPQSSRLAEFGGLGMSPLAVPFLRVAVLATGFAAPLLLLPVTGSNIHAPFNSPVALRLADRRLSASGRN